MGVTVLNRTTEFPLSVVGEVAGICWDSPTDDAEKNRKRGISCIRSGHTRVAEWVNIELILEGYSARCIRELARHIIGTSFLQSSTRYVDAKNMDIDNEFFYPPKLTDEGREVYKECLENIMESYEKVEELGLPKEDAANLLPLGMHSKVVWKMNLRAFMHLANLRLCNRAYHEIRGLVNDMKEALRNYSDEWTYVCDHYIVPKCEVCGYCEEDHSCGRKPKKTMKWNVKKLFQRIDLDKIHYRGVLKLKDGKVSFEKYPGFGDLYVYDDKKISIDTPFLDDQGIELPKLPTEVEFLNTGDVLVYNGKAWGVYTNDD